MRWPSLRSLAPLGLALALTLGCGGAPDDPYGSLTPPVATPTATASPTPSPTPTRPPPTPTPTPVPWDDYQITKVTLKGNVADLWLELEDEAVAFTDALLDTLVETGTISQAEAKAYELARNALFNELFSPTGLSDVLSDLLATGQAYVSQRVIPGSGDAFTLDYYIWNLGGGADECRAGSLPGTGKNASGQLNISFEIPTLGGSYPATLRVLQARAFVAPLKNNTLEGVIPYNDLETLFIGLAEGAYENLEVPEEVQAQYTQDLEEALRALKSQYATVTLSDGSKAIPSEGLYDASALPKGALPYRYAGP